jgi:hypothetical protein
LWSRDYDVFDTDSSDCSDKADNDDTLGLELGFENYFLISKGVVAGLSSLSLEVSETDSLDFSSDFSEIIN